jgi:hypothetical protein
MMSDAKKFPDLQHYRKGRNQAMLEGNLNHPDIILTTHTL